MTRMEIEVPDFRVRAVARLYDEYAPKTIKALATVLPFTGPGIHAIRAGREVFTLIPGPRTDPGEENQSVFPIPGDLYLFHQREGYRPYTTSNQPREWAAEITETRRLGAVRLCADPAAPDCVTALAGIWHETNC